MQLLYNTHVLQDCHGQLLCRAPVPRPLLSLTCVLAYVCACMHPLSMEDDRPTTQGSTQLVH